MHYINLFVAMTKQEKAYWAWLSIHEASVGLLPQGVQLSFLANCRSKNITWRWSSDVFDADAHDDLTSILTCTGADYIVSFYSSRFVRLRWRGQGRRHNVLWIFFWGRGDCRATCQILSSWNDRMACRLPTAPCSSRVNCRRSASVHYIFVID